MQTGLEIYKGVLQELNKSNTMSMTPEEFNHHAKIGMSEWLKMRYWAFDKHQKNIDDLSPIIIIGNPDTPILLAGGGDTQGIEEFLMPDELLYLLKVKWKLEYNGDACFADGFTTDYKHARYRTHNLSTENFYHKASNDQLFYLQSGNRIVRVGERATTKVTHSIIHYLRYPLFPEVDNLGANVTDSEFGVMQNIEIVKWITASYLEKIESLRSQSMLGIQSQVFTHQTNVH